MDKRFKKLLIKAELLRGKPGYVKFIKEVEDTGNKWGLFKEDTEESIAYRAEAAAFILEKYENENIGSVLNLPLEHRIKIINRGENAAGIPKLIAIQKHKAFPKCVPEMDKLGYKIKQAINEILNGNPKKPHTQIILEKLESCDKCEAVCATFGWYEGGYGYSVNSGWFLVIFDKEGNKIKIHNCDSINQ